MVREVPAAMLAAVQSSFSSWKVGGSDGQTNRAEVPWCRFFDPALSPKPTVGWYVVYLFRADGGAVYLSLNQGISTWQPDRRGFVKQPAQQIAERVGWARHLLADSGADPDGFRGIELHSVRGKLGRQYERGNVRSVMYRADDIPNDDQLHHDLRHLANELNLLYSADQVFAQGARAAATTRPAAQVRRGFLTPFRPKADTDYVANIEPSKAKRSRAHETLVNDFAEWLEARGLVAANNFAVDIGTVDPPTVIEAKRVNGQFANAIRSAVGQLYEYRYFKVAHPDSGLIFLSDEPVPEVWCSYLERDRAIGVIWPAQGGFHLSTLAQRFLGAASD
ncbi:MrcB family domain-containing protein [Nocardia colli]|uniref:MrcB family domain-containing protein n=1 Tax=Nocardia colli TaxID=2545717 RepID=UPI0035DD3852